MWSARVHATKQGNRLLVPRDAWELSRRYDEHPICDLVYVALARRLGEVLLTADRKLVDRLRDPRVRLVG